MCGDGPQIPKDLARRQTGSNYCRLRARAFSGFETCEACEACEDLTLRDPYLAIPKQRFAEATGPSGKRLLIIHLIIG